MLVRFGGSVADQAWAQCRLVARCVISGVTTFGERQLPVPHLLLMARRMAGRPGTQRTQHHEGHGSNVECQSYSGGRIPGRPLQPATRRHCGGDPSQREHGDVSDAEGNDSEIPRRQDEESRQLTIGEEHDDEQGDADRGLL